MAVTESVQRLVSRVRRKSQPQAKDEQKDETEERQYDPPPGPPPNHQLYGYPPPLNPVHLPLVLPEHQFNLAVQGWTTLSFPKRAAFREEQERAIAMRASVESLFAAGRTFFDMPADYKSQFLTKQGSEEGWNSIPGEKEFITVRSLSRVPVEIREAAIKAWSVFGSLLCDSLTQIAESLGLESEALVRFAKPCSNIKEESTATMLRIFRYETWEDKVVAEPHNDLGLLSLVVGNSPGLEVWSPMIRSFYPIEQSYKDLSSTGSLLVGRQLQRFSNGRYVPGGHRVMSYPKDDVPKGKRMATGKKYRYSVVFVLRAHYDEILNVKSLTSPITGENRMVKDGESARQFFTNLRSSYYNINTNLKERASQKNHIHQKKAQAESPDANGSSAASTQQPEEIVHEAEEPSAMPQTNELPDKPLQPGTG